jgi:hypothetical protein
MFGITVPYIDKKCNFKLNRRKLIIWDYNLKIQKNMCFQIASNDLLFFFLSLRDSSIGYEPYFMKWRSLVRISPPPLVWTCQKKK